MMLQRKILNTFRQWKDEKTSECLLVKGARQVGKTFAIRQFGQESYESVVELNFIESPRLKSAFDEELSPQEIRKRITLLLPGASFVPGRTLLFLDEIQECPNARTALKFLAEDSSVDVVASGSLLGISYSEVSSIPVGYERQIEMSGLDFEEFLWAVGYSEEAVRAIRDHLASFESFPADIHETLLGKLREYLAVGGMPAVVSAFVRENSFATAFAEQEMILNAYLDDIAKYATPRDRNKARDCYLSIPRQLAKENTKFRYGVVEKKGSARKFETALDWLRDANLIRYCRSVTTASFPLRAYEDEQRFRVYLSDPGLLCAMYGFDMMAAIVEDKLQGPMKGGLYENLVADMLAKAGFDLHYWMNDKGNIEIEFLLEHDASVVPVEVKAKKGATASLNTFLERDDISRGYKLSAGNIGVSGKKITLPLYAGAFLRDIIAVQPLPKQD